MKYGYFDDENREYVIDRPDVPVSWTNYIGVSDLCTVISHNAGGYSFYKSAEHHRITRFRQNGVPLDRPGHYVYVRDDETGEFWSISWQPVGKDLSKAKYQCRHGLSYSRFLCDYNGVRAEQTLFIPIEDDVELWDVRLNNTSKKSRRLSVFSFAGILLPPYRNRQPEPPDVPVRQRVQLLRRGHRIRLLLRAVDLPLISRPISSPTDSTASATGFSVPTAPRRIPSRWNRAHASGARNWAGIIARPCTGGSS